MFIWTSNVQMFPKDDLFTKYIYLFTKYIYSIIYYDKGEGEYVMVNIFVVIAQV